MPYRAELKRPDLKGQFPCSVCGKVFCHSSSLSRHRMQAHFKSYTCTQCNQEISSNETLRSHMFRIHSISRMFMCRCCNWAFSDKTSLHIHMQSMLRNGTPGEVAILARSSTEDGTGAVVEDSPGSSPSYSAKNLLQHQFVSHDAMDATTTTSSNLNNNNNNNNGNNNNNNTKAANNNSNCVKSIFPMIMRKDNLLTQMKKENVLPLLDFSSLSSNRWFSAWLANNPFVPNMNELQQRLCSTTDNESLSSETDYNRSLEDSDYDVLKITMSESDMHEEEIETRQNTTSVIVNPCCISELSGEGVRGSHKRKATRPQQVTDVVEVGDSGEKEEPSCKQPYCNEDLEKSEQSCSNSATENVQIQITKPECSDCQATKDKLNESQSKVLEYERKINHLEAKILELQRDVLERRPTSIDENRSGASGDHSQLAIPPVPAAVFNPNLPPALLFMHNPAVKFFLHSLVQSQLSRPSC
ncbi:hypothetical protein Q1695_000391 [Nippostrongylus brasiliensis]|nr:hypothetical protein Q1695_000391 [Nippostrongylus brasiliensis]